jgi:hypothetical protein
MSVGVSVTGCVCCRAAGARAKACHEMNGEIDQDGPGHSVARVAHRDGSSFRVWYLGS